jgi:hypothetical protein
MEGEGYSDGQMATAVTAETGKPLSGQTFRRYFDRAKRPVVLKPLRMRNKSEKFHRDPKAAVIEHNAKETPPSNVFVGDDEEED